MSRSNTLRVIAVIGLLSAALFIALPWLGCVANARVFGGTSPDDYLFWPRLCTVGSSSGQNPFPVSVMGALLGLPGFTGPYWGNLVVGIAYLVAAVYVAVSKRF